MLVAPGTYYEHGIVLPAGITVIGDSEYPESIVIDATGGQDVFLTLHRSSGTIYELRWNARPQVTSVDGYDAFRGTYFFLAGDDPNLTTLGCIAADVAQQPVGNQVSVLDDGTVPALGDAFYFFIGHSPRAVGGLAPLGLWTDGTIRISPVTCP